MSDVNRKTKINGGVPYTNLKYMAKVCIPEYEIDGIYLVGIELFMDRADSVSLNILKDGMDESLWLYLSVDEFKRYITPIKDNEK